MRNAESAIDDAVDLILKYGGIDGGHHKQWVLDQVLRILLGDGYGDQLRARGLKFVDGNTPCCDEFVCDCDVWDGGIAP